MTRKNKRQYGTGSLIKRGRSWMIRWGEKELAEDGTEKRVFRSETLGPISRKDAADILAQRVAASAKKPVARTRLTFRELINQWKATVLPMYKHSTQKGHLHIVDKHLLPRFDGQNVSRIARQEIQGYIACLNKRYAPKTVDHIHDVLSAVLRTAVKWGYIPDNPTKGVDLPILRTVRPKYALTLQQASDLLSALPLLPKTMVGLDILTGLRRGELFALRWKHLDWNARTLTVSEAVYEGQFNSPKTEAGNRVVPLCDSVLDLLLEWRTEAKRTQPDDLVFCTRSGKPISPNNILRRFVFPACDALKLPKATWLTFRRTYSLWSHDKGVPGKVVAQLMGHANVYTTLNTYTQVLDDSLRVAAERIGADLKLITIDHNKGDSRPLN